MSYTYLKQYLRKHYHTFWQIIKQCSLKDLIRNNATVIVPTKPVLDQLQKLVDAENYAEATGILKCYILKTVYKNIDDFKAASVIANSCFKQLVVKKINESNVEVENATIELDAKYKPAVVCDLPNNTSVWTVSSGEISTGTKAVSAANAARRQRPQQQQGSCDKLTAFKVLRDNLLKWFGQNDFSIGDKFMEIFCKVLHIIKSDPKYECMYLQCKSFFTGVVILDMLFVFYNNTLVSYEHLNEIINATHTYNFAEMKISPPSVSYYTYYLEFCAEPVKGAQGVLLTDKRAMHNAILGISLPTDMSVVQTYKDLITQLTTTNTLPNMQQQQQVFEPIVFAAIKGKHNLLMNIFEIQYLMYKLLVNTQDIKSVVLNMFVVTFKCFDDDPTCTVLQHIKKIELFDSVSDTIRFVTEVIHFIFRPFSDTELRNLNVTKFLELKQLATS